MTTTAKKEDNKKEEIKKEDNKNESKKTPGVVSKVKIAGPKKEDKK